MTARTHDVAAITALGIAVLLYAPGPVRLSTLLLAVLANQLGGVTPDIDQPTAPLWRNLPEGHFVGRVFGKLVGGHRFLSHSILGFAIFAWLSNLLLHSLHPIMPHVDILLVWYAFLIGYASHLVMDTLTKEGVPWLLPIPIKFGVPPLKKFRVTTGHAVENLVVLPALVLFDIWLCSSHYHTFVSLLHHVMS
ncbi:MAG: metal-dependent hydrolase [Candidatus Saccharibacteria bacterium]